jgi:two-component system copper resistance phosphate regulon response regulator CusR
MAAVVAKVLRDESYAVDIAPNGDEALFAGNITPYDFAILDVRLPLKDGFSVCRELRAGGFRAPILMLSALDDPEDLVCGFDCGADDYLPKPFDFRVLLARMRALLRRSDRIRPPVIEIGELSLNTRDHTASRAGRLIRLTAKEYSLLELFVLHPGEILGREVIAQHVWDERFDPFSNVIDVYINRLRKKIDQNSSRSMIQTRRSEGYILEYQVRQC